MTHIDVGAILQTAHSRGYTDLVTRATGRTVRTRIEQDIQSRPRTLSVIDFSSIGLLDFSCADEIVANLMRRWCSDSPDTERYIVFDGINDDHLDAIEHVLENHDLALVARFSGHGKPRLVGAVHDLDRLVWETVVRLQPALPSTVSVEAALDYDDVISRLVALHRKRLLMKDGSMYRVPIGAVA
jgi:hypothetical protein